MYNEDEGCKRRSRAVAYYQSVSDLVEGLNRSIFSIKEHFLYKLRKTTA
jgi:hypothetical protein